MGLFMSGIYPLAMSLTTSLKLKVTPKNTSRYVLGGCIGSSLPFITGLLVVMLFIIICMIFTYRKVLKHSQHILNPTIIKSSSSADVL
jgi:fucose permease